MGLFDSIASIADKLIPGRKEKLYNEMQKYENELRWALMHNNTVGIAQCNRMLAKIRSRIKNIDV